MDVVNSNIWKISFLLLGLVVLFIFIFFVLINNIICLVIYFKCFLIYIMKLVGVSWGFICCFFLVWNIWIGILVVVMVDVVLIGMVYVLVRYEFELIEIIIFMIMFMVMGFVFVFGVVIIFMCVYILINKYLCMKVSVLYYI